MGCRLFKMAPVVHTARGTRSSIGERFDNKITGSGQFLAEWIRDRPGKCRFHTPYDLSGTEAAPEYFLHAIEEKISFRFADVEQADSFVLEVG